MGVFEAATHDDLLLAPWRARAAIAPNYTQCRKRNTIASLLVGPRLDDRSRADDEEKGSRLLLALTTSTVGRGGWGEAKKDAPSSRAATMQSLVGSPTVTSLMTCAPVAALMRAPISQSTTHEERRHGLPDSPALTPPDEKCRLEEVLCQETLLLESKNPTEAASPAAASEFLLTTRVSELEQALTSSMRENVSAVAARRDAEMTIARLETALAAERLRADSMEAENLRLKQEAEEAETNRQVSALWDVIPPTPTLGDVSSRRSRRSSTLSRGLCTPARAVAISPAASEGFCETPSWLREADGFAQSDADEANAAMARAAAAMAAEAEAKAAADEKGRAAAEAEEAAEKAAVAAAEAAARTAAALAAASTAEAARTAAEEQRAQMQAKAEASLSAKARELAAAC